MKVENTTAYIYSLCKRARDCSIEGRQFNDQSKLALLYTHQLCVKAAYETKDIGCNTLTTNVSVAQIV